jgi:hypothetical protein
MSQTELAHTLTAVIGLPVTLAYTHIVAGASTVTIASIGALTIHHHGDIGGEGSN